MTNADKWFLRSTVKMMVKALDPDDKIVDRMERMGFKKATIKKYIKAFKTLTP